MTEKPTKYEALTVEDMIVTIRGQKVILDSALARLYGVETKRLNEQVRRNADRFPSDFMFRLAIQEVRSLRSQNATGSLKHRDPRFRPYAFTEHGAIMAANVLNSRQAVEMSVFVVRAFIKMREQLLDRAELEKRLAEIEKVLLSHDAALRGLYRKIKPLLLPLPSPPRRQIGFGMGEKHAETSPKRKGA